jgi:hypothetical protein
VTEKPNNSLNDYRRLQLRALGVDELPKRHRVVVHVEDPEMSVKETLELLDRQNKGLASSEWIVVTGGESRDAKSAHFAALIGDRPLEKLKALNFKPYCNIKIARQSTQGE